MKKLITIALLAFMVASVSAQAGKSRSMWLGGRATFETSSEITNIVIAPSWGMMLGDQFGLGATVRFYTGSNSYGIGFDPYVRYYIPVSDQFSFYGDAYLGIQLGDESTNFDGFGIYADLSLGARLGLQYWLTPSWSIAASTTIFGITSKAYEQDTEATTRTRFGINFNSVYFSLFWHF